MRENAPTVSMLTMERICLKITKMINVQCRSFLRGHVDVDWHTYKKTYIRIANEPIILFENEKFDLCLFRELLWTVSDCRKTSKHEMQEIFRNSVK